MKKSCSGFSLVELLITLSIIALLFSLGLTQYNRFNRRQVLIRAKDNLVSELRLTQAKSLAAEKPDDCGVNPLVGHKLEFTSNQSYQIVAVCGGVLSVVKDGMSLPIGVIKDSGPDEILFKVLSQGIDIDGEQQIIITDDFGQSQTVTINNVGEIK